MTGSAPLAAAVTQILPAAGVAYPRYGEFVARVVVTDDALHLRQVEIARATALPRCRCGPSESQTPTAPTAM